MARVSGLGGFRLKTLVAVLVVAFAATVFVRPQAAEAHCDSVNGPVVGAAKEALVKGDVRLILPYVQPEAEVALTTAFNQAVKVRKLGGSAQQLAETYFFETAVRLHREGEGATYTGLKYDSDFGPALTAAEQALETDSPKEVARLLDETLAHGLAEKFEAVQAARKNATRLGTVEAQRERAEAELIFEKYVLELYTAATGAAVHAEGAATAGHAAAAPAH